MRNSLEYNIDLPLGITNFNGVNIPWLVYETGGKIKHDGYSNGFNDFYFNGENANTSIQAQLDILVDNNVKYLRLWLNISSYMNADKDSVGYTEFRAELLTNLETYCDWCEEKGLKLIICFDDCWYTMRWSWMHPDSEFRNSYIQAFKDIVTVLKNHSAVFGWDYGNEPYMGWHWDLESYPTYRWFGGTMQDVGVTPAQMSDFFDELYTELKAIAPTQLFSVGSSTPSENVTYSIGNQCDFYQRHWYGSDPNSFTTKASDYDKPVIIGEYGHSNYNNMRFPEFNKQMMHKFFQAGFGLIMTWSLTQMITRTGVGQYSAHQSLTQLKLWQE